MTPKGHMYLVGGYLPLIDHFSRSTFILDEHRSALVPRSLMFKPRCDHALHYHEERIYALGGISSVEN